jgi:putative transposase
MGFISLNKNKYRIETTRLRSWNYSSGVAYFITICTKDRVPFPGKIEQGKMQLSEHGKIAEQCWNDRPKH